MLFFSWRFKGLPILDQWIDTVKSEWTIIYGGRGGGGGGGGGDTRYNFKKYFVFTNSADPDEIPPYSAFHLGLHCLPK